MGKRLFDLLFSTVAIVATAPLWILIAAGIALSSPGPVFYLGTRTGRHGVPFKIVKFRTMVVDAEKIGGGTTALDDPRVFPLGRLLRRYKLDELPQFINVLRGEMSLVGPRPELPLYTNRYSEEEKVILSVRPGITDLSSIQFSSLDESVGRHDADRVFETKVLPAKNRLRVHYVVNQSFLLDLRILAMTVLCIIRKITR